MYRFEATLEIIGINPFVSVPEGILRSLFVDAGKSTSPIQIKGFINDTSFTQTLVKYKGAWRLYVNTSMLRNSPKRVAELVTLSIEYDPSSRKADPHPKLVQALDENPDAKVVFDSLSNSMKNEMVKYISNLKTEASIDKNVARAIGFLTGKERFIGRDSPVAKV